MLPADGLSELLPAFVWKQKKLSDMWNGGTPETRRVLHSFIKCNKWNWKHYVKMTGDEINCLVLGLTSDYPPQFEKTSAQIMNEILKGQR